MKCYGMHEIKISATTDMSLAAHKGFRKSTTAIGLFLGIVIVLSLTVTPPAVAQRIDPAALERLERIIQQQQRQFRELQQQQQRQLRDLQQQVNELKQASKKALTDANEARSTANKAIKASSDQARGSKVVTSGGDRVKLAISGQINRMINVADDGDTTKVFHVDNDNSSTRLRFVGSGKVTDDFTIGTNIEVQMESNSSGVVNQTNESTGGVSFTDRKLEAFFDSKRFGKISIGQGSTASDGTAEVDLSGTDVIAYSSVEDLAGGLLFRNSATGQLTTISVGNVFANFDGLGRNDRLRYDSPPFAGFRAAASHASDDQWDVALRWGGEGNGFRIAAAGAYSSNNSGTTDYRLDGSVSMLHLDTGLSLTVAAGTDSNDGARSDAHSYYVKAGWRHDFFDVGETAYTIDWSRNQDIAQNDDESTSIGGYIVQNLSDYGTQFYGGVRNYELDRAGTATDDILVFSAGTRVKF